MNIDYQKYNFYNFKELDKFFKEQIIVSIWIETNGYADQSMQEKEGLV